jgi:ribosomal protein S18 acetylase RimI-like enzyme
MNEDLIRAHAFARRMRSRLCTDALPFPGGVAYRDFPLRYDSNLLWVEDPGTAPAARWAEEAERILGARGYRHRRVVVPDLVAAERLSEAFVALGYEADGGVLMVQEGEPDRPAGEVAVEELSYAEVRPLLEEVTRHEDRAHDEETVRMLTDYRGKLEDTIGARFFAARVQGKLAGCCELYVEGDEAQVESVETLEAFRGRGLARAYVLAAADAGREAGANWVHLWADTDDWPRHWYGRLGFREAGYALDFARLPQAEAAAMKAAKSPEA